MLATVYPWWRQSSSDPLPGQIVGFVVPALATWRLAFLLWAEDGPWNLVARLRRWAADRGARAFDCFYCLSLWVAAPIALIVAWSVSAWLLDWLAFSAASILLERITTSPAAPPRAAWRIETPPDAPD